MPLIGFLRRRSPLGFGRMIMGLDGLNKAANEFGGDDRSFGNVWPRCATEVPICDHAAGSRSMKNANAPVRRELPRRLPEEGPGRRRHPKSCRHGELKSYSRTRRLNREPTLAR